MTKKKKKKKNLALSSPKTCPNPVGHKRKKKGPQKQGQSSFFRTQFVRVYKDIWYMKTISVFRPAPVLNMVQQQITKVCKKSMTTKIYFFIFLI